MQPTKKTLLDVEAAFVSRAIFDSSTRELEEFLAAIAAEKIPDASERAHASAMSQTIRELLARQRLDRSLRPSSRFASVTFAIALLALAISAAQFYVASRNREDFTVSPVAPNESLTDPRTRLSLWELARFSPTIRKGSLQSWWAGEQARRVFRLEAEARRELLAGDKDGAARSIAQADAIRAEIPLLVDSEKPVAH